MQLIYAATAAATRRRPVTAAGCVETRWVYVCMKRLLFLCFVAEMWIQILLELFFLIKFLFIQLPTHPRPCCSCCCCCCCCCCCSPARVVFFRLRESCSFVVILCFSLFIVCLIYWKRGFLIVFSVNKIYLRPSLLSFTPFKGGSICCCSQLLQSAAAAAALL